MRSPIHFASCLFLFIAILVAWPIGFIQATELQVRVTVGDTAPNGGSYDGTRVFLLPVEATTASPPDLAVCIHTDAGETRCDPSDLINGLSPCPDKKSCILSVKFEKPFEYFALSVFDIDPLGRDAAKSFRKFLKENLKKVEKELDVDLQSGEIADAIGDANARRWQWIETVSMVKEEEVSPFEKGNAQVDKTARNFAAAIAPPQLLSKFEEGRISASFELKPMWDCLYPAPACLYDYVEITLNSKELAEEAGY